MANFFHNPERSEIDISKNQTYVLIIDCSGSMIGERIESAKTCADCFLRSLPNGCNFEIILFGSEFKSITEGICEYNERNCRWALKMIDDVQANYGGTEIYQPLNHIFKTHNERPNAIFIMSDGEVSNKKDILNLVMQHKEKNRIFALGISDEADMELIHGLGTITGGDSQCVINIDEIPNQVINQLEKSLSPRLSLDFDIDGASSFEKFPFPNQIYTPGQLSHSFFKIQGIITQNPSIMARMFDAYHENSLVFESTLIDNGEFIKRLVNYQKILHIKRQMIGNPNSSDFKNQIIALSQDSGILTPYTSYVGTTLSPNQSMRIFVKTLNGVHKTLDVDELDTVESLKQQIQAIEGIPIDDQRLLFAGRSFENEYTLKDYSVKKDTTVDLVLRLRGGSDEEDNPQELISSILMHQQFKGCFSGLKSLQILIPRKQNFTIQDKYIRRIPISEKELVLSTLLALHLLRNYTNRKYDTQWKLISKKAMKYLYSVSNDIDWDSVLDSIRY